jgi:hypothetical protein
MSHHEEDQVIRELLELRSIEEQLHSKWKRLGRSRKDVRASFISAMRELESRAEQLERVLDSSTAMAA